MKKHVNNLLSRDLCTGCTACKSSCPKACIKMKEDDEGFKYPVVDEDVCVDCSICSSVCPVLNLPASASKETVFAMVSRDEEGRDRSSSGGMMSLLAEHILKKNGTVYGAAYDDEFRVVHRRVDSTENLDQIRRAKYSQSDPGDIFDQVKEDLKSGPVLFVGTPCQCAGLSFYINRSKRKSLKKPVSVAERPAKEPETGNQGNCSGNSPAISKEMISESGNSHDLILVDFVCHSIPSPKVWDRYVKWRSGSEKPSEINQRSKATGWSNYTYSSEFSYSSGKQELVSNGQDIYMKLFIGGYITRPSCSECSFKGNSRTSDLTLGDFWGIWDLEAEMDDNRGTSLVIVHTEKGKEILDAIDSGVNSKRIDLDKALAQNPAYFRKSSHPEQRKQIMERALNSDFDSLRKELIPAAPKTSRIRKLASSLIRHFKDE